MRGRLILITTAVLLAHLALFTSRPARDTRQGTTPAATRSIQVRIVTTEPSPAPEAPTGVAPEPQPKVDAGADASADPDDRYLPRSALSRAPAALQQVELPYPEAAPLGQYRAVLTLFIDAQGRVRRVRAAPGLPAALEEAARQAFLAANFSPGEVDGRAVRSQMRVEVEFSAELAGQSRAPR